MQHHGLTSSRTGESCLCRRRVRIGLTAPGRRFSWSGRGGLSIDGSSADFTRQLNNAFALRLEIQPDAVPGPVILSFARKTFDIGAMLRGLSQGRLSTLKIPLRCFANAGAGVNAVATPLKIEAGVGTILSLRSVVIEAVGEPLACP
ncbi:MAG: putative glycoside hydrolase [Sphingomicrobium sp.]